MPEDSPMDLLGVGIDPNWPTMVHIIDRNAPKFTYTKRILSVLLLLILMYVVLLPKCKTSY
jgi:hypothetical protein